MKRKMPSQPIEFMLAPFKSFFESKTYATITSGEVVTFAGYESVTFAVYKPENLLNPKQNNEFAVCVVCIGRNLPNTLANSKNKAIRLAQKFLDGFTLEKLNDGIKEHSIVNPLFRQNESIKYEFRNQSTD